MLLVGLAATLPAGAAPKPKPVPCAGGRFLVQGDPLLPGAAAQDVVVVGDTVRVESGCGPVTARLKVAKKRTRFATRFPTCSGVSGKVSLSAIFSADCASITGTLRTRKPKRKRTFSATRSTCGDGIVDAGAESCDGAAGCPGSRCDAACTCPPNEPPVASFSAATTVVAGRPLAFDAAASSDPDGQALAYAWDFGDGGRGGGAAIAHVFPSSGAFTVTLTVADGAGGTATAAQAVTVTPGPSPTGTVVAQGTITTTAGGPLSGVGATLVGGTGSGTSNASGIVELPVPVGVPAVVRLTKSGFAAQTVVVQVPDGAEGAVFEAAMLPREAEQTLAAAEQGGALAGKDGAQVILPAGALAGPGGAPVTGAVQVSLTPVNPVADPTAFPGQYAGIAPDREGLLFSYGTVEFALSQNGQPVNLTPGATATVELPCYATVDADGTPLAVGGSMPIWSLDEATGQWVQEGIGTIVASSGSPTGLALRGIVGHFSWWNADKFGENRYEPKPRCLVDTDHDGKLEDLTGTGFCWHYGTGPEQGGPGTFAAPAMRARAEAVPVFPRFAAQVMLPPTGGVPLPIPANVDFYLRSSAKGGSLKATTVLRGAPGVREDVDVILEEVGGPITPISIPWDQTYTMDAVLETDRYAFSAAAGATVYVTVSRAQGSNLGGEVFVDGPGAVEFGPAPFGSTAGVVAFAAPVSGQYVISVQGTGGAPNAYRLRAQDTGTVPILLSTVPAFGATNVGLASTIVATFSQAIDPGTVTASSFKVEQAGTTVEGSRAVNGATVTFTPAEPLSSGGSFAVTLSTQIRAGGVALTTPISFGFTTAEVLGAPASVASGSSTDIVALANGQALVSFRKDASTVGVVRYVPGQGWGTPQHLNTGQTYFGTRLGTNGTSAIVVWQQSDAGSSSPRSLWASRYSGGTWSAGTVIESSTEDPAGDPASPRTHVVMDAAGNAIVVYATTALHDLWWNRYTAGVGWGTATVLVSAGPTLSLGGVDLAMNAAGDAVLVWHVGGGAVQARRFTPAGGWSTDTVVGQNAAALDPHVGIDDEGNALALFRQGGSYRAVRYDASDAAWSASSHVVQADASGASLAPDDDAGILLTPSGVALAVGHAFTTEHLVWAARYTPGAGGTAGTWGVATPLDLGGNQIFPVAGVRFAMNASEAGVAVWSETYPSTTLRYKRYAAATGWDASYTTIPSINQTSHRPRVAVGAGGAAFILAESPSLAVRVTRVQ